MDTELKQGPSLLVLQLPPQLVTIREQAGTILCCQTLGSCWGSAEHWLLLLASQLRPAAPRVPNVAFQHSPEAERAEVKIYGPGK